MAATSLYRRYRPQRFSEVKGQEHVTQALQRAVAEGRWSHAYLFSGPRGTGKTSTARILAKALNCEHLVDGEPDGTCDACRAIETGTSYDLQELDAASNNRVENVRELIERVALGSPGRTKVYILDEVHMLSPGASNALLKTLEEPPPHVVFVLATTDPQKVLPTIRSRTQHFEFHLLPAQVLDEHVRWLIDDAGLDVPAEAVQHVLRAGGGSARDTLSALDQVAAGGVAERGEHPEALVDALCEGDTAGALATVAAAVATGRDPRILGEGLLARLRDVFLARMGGPLEHLPEADRARVSAWAGRMTDRTTTRALEELGSALLEMRQAPDARIPLEVALVRLTRAGAASDLDALAARLERLERLVGSGGLPDAAPVAASPVAAAPPVSPPPAPPPATPPASPRPVAPAASGGRPADGARAALNGAVGGAGEADASPAPMRRSARQTASATGDAPAAGRRPPLPPRPSPRGRGPQATAGTAGSPPSISSADAADAVDAADASSPAGATAAPAPSGAPDLATLSRAWTEAVLPSLGGLTKALFMAGSVSGVDGDRLVVGLPNDVHRQRCEQKRSEVEAALAAHFGRAIAVQLVVEVPATVPLDAGAGAVRPLDDDPDPREVPHLADAPDDDRSAADRLMEAFGGGELAEEESR